MATVTSRRTDHDIRESVLDELQWAPEVDASRVAVEVDGGFVTLSGAVDSLAERLAAKRAAQRVRGVTNVHDDIAVLPVSSDGRPSDAELQEAARRVLDAMQALPGTIRVEVHEHTVALTGEVMWDHQRRLARGLVSQLRGVVHVDSRIALARRPSAPDTQERIRKALQRAATLEGAVIDVSVLGNAVTLAGRVRSASDRALAEEIAWNAPSVTTVHNLIGIRGSRAPRDLGP